MENQTPLPTIAIDQYDMTVLAESFRASQSTDEEYDSFLPAFLEFLATDEGMQVTREDLAKIVATLFVRFGVYHEGIKMIARVHDVLRRAVEMDAVDSLATALMTLYHNEMHPAIYAGAVFNTVMEIVIEQDERLNSADYLRLRDWVSTFWESGTTTEELEGKFERETAAEDQILRESKRAFSGGKKPAQA